MPDVICKLSVFVPELGVILWTGASEEAIKDAAARKYAGYDVRYGAPHYVERTRV